MVAINTFLILTKQKYIKIYFKNPAEYWRFCCHKGYLQSRVCGTERNVLNIVKVLLVHLKLKCVCPQKATKCPWQHKLKSAVLEIFVNMTLIKAKMRDSRMCSEETPLTWEMAAHLAVALSTGKGTWRRCFLRGWATHQSPLPQAGFGAEIRLVVAFQPLAWCLALSGFSGTLCQKSWLRNVLLIHPQFPDLLPTSVKQKTWCKKTMYKQETQGVLWAKKPV